MRYLKGVLLPALAVSPQVDSGNTMTLAGAGCSLSFAVPHGYALKLDGFEPCLSEDEIKKNEPKYKLQTLEDALQGKNIMKMLGDLVGIGQDQYLGKAQVSADDNSSLICMSANDERQLAKYTLTTLEPSAPWMKKKLFRSSMELDASVARKYCRLIISKVLEAYLQLGIGGNELAIHPGVFSKEFLTKFVSKDALIDWKKQGGLELVPDLPFVGNNGLHKDDWEVYQAEKTRMETRNSRPARGPGMTEHDMEWDAGSEPVKGSSIQSHESGGQEGEHHKGGPREPEVENKEHTGLVGRTEEGGQGLNEEHLNDDTIDSSEKNSQGAKGQDSDLNSTQSREGLDDHENDGLNEDDINHPPALTSSSGLDEAPLGTGHEQEGDKGINNEDDAIINNVDPSDVNNGPNGVSLVDPAHPDEGSDITNNLGQKQDEEGEKLTTLEDIAPNVSELTPNDEESKGAAISALPPAVPTDSKSNEEIKDGAINSSIDPSEVMPSDMNLTPDSEDEESNGGDAIPDGALPPWVPVDSKSPLFGQNGDEESTDGMNVGASNNSFGETPQEEKPTEDAVRKNSVTSLTFSDPGTIEADEKNTLSDVENNLENAPVSGVDAINNINEETVLHEAANIDELHHSSKESQSVTASVGDNLPSDPTNNQEPTDNDQDDQQESESLDSSISAKPNSAAVPTDTIDTKPTIDTDNTTKSGPSNNGEDEREIPNALIEEDSKGTTIGDVEEIQPGASIDELDELNNKRVDSETSEDTQHALTESIKSIQEAQSKQQELDLQEASDTTPQDERRENDKSEADVIDEVEAPIP